MVFGHFGRLSSLLGSSASLISNAIATSRWLVLHHCQLQPLIFGSNFSFFFFRSNDLVHYPPSSAPLPPPLSLTEPLILKLGFFYYCIGLSFGFFGWFMGFGRWLVTGFNLWVAMCGLCLGFWVAMGGWDSRWVLHGFTLWVLLDFDFSSSSSFKKKKL